MCVCVVLCTCVDCTPGVHRRWMKREKKNQGNDDGDGDVMMVVVVLLYNSLMLQ
jgi:hypothetical protein